MELISKVSKGTKMDQIYIPKNRSGFGVGSYVLIQSMRVQEQTEKPYFHNIQSIEPLKLEIINQIFNIIPNQIENYENIIITGSFLDEGFNFKDIDLIIVSEDKLDEALIKKEIEEILKIKIHIITLNNKTLIKGLSTDPLYQMMLSKCISKKRFIYKIQSKIDYKLLDIHLLKSELLILNFDHLNGHEKYYLTRNMIAISLFLKHEKIDKEKIDKEIKKIFNLKDINEIKQNILNKDKFLKEYKFIYKDTFNKIMENIKNDSK